MMEFNGSPFSYLVVFVIGFAGGATVIQCWAYALDLFRSMFDHNGNNSEGHSSA